MVLGGELLPERPNGLDKISLGYEQSKGEPVNSSHTVNSSHRKIV